MISTDESNGKNCLHYIATINDLSNKFLHRDDGNNVKKYLPSTPQMAVLNWIKFDFFAFFCGQLDKRS